MKTHPLNVTHLTIGLILLGLSALWGADAAGWTDFGDSAYLVPVLLIGAGVIGLIAFTFRGTRRTEIETNEEYPS
jgi:hypothetical protein